MRTRHCIFRWARLLALSCVVMVGSTQSAHAEDVDCSDPANDKKECTPQLSAKDSPKCYEEKGVCLSLKCHPKHKGWGISCGDNCERCHAGECKASPYFCYGGCVYTGGLAGECIPFLDQCICTVEIAWSGGEPHLLTRDGLMYDLHATGDFVLLATDTGIVIQTRQTQVPNRPGLAWNTATAIRLGSHRINVVPDPLRLSIDGTQVELADGVPHWISDGDELVVSGLSLFVERATGDRIEIATNPSYPMLDVKATIVSGPSRGLLGDGDGDPTNDLAIRNGPTLSYPAPYADLYGPFVQSWVVSPEESLFDDISPPVSAPESGNGRDDGHAADPFAAHACESDGDEEAHNPGWPSHEPGTCADGAGFLLSDAIALCGGDVKYYGYACSDFPAQPPYQPHDERGWTAYYACCSAAAGSRAEGADGEGGRLPGSVGHVGLALPPPARYGVPDHPFTLVDLDPADRREAEQACAAAGVSNRAWLDACMIDVAATGDTMFAEPYRHMPVPRLVLVPTSDGESAEPDHASAQAHGCAIAQAGPAAPWLSLVFMTTVACCMRLAGRGRRAQRSAS